MRIANDLNASLRISTAIKLRRASALRAQFVHGALLIALCSGCSALTDFGDFEFGPKNGETRDSGAADSGERDAGPNQPDKDGGGGAGGNSSGDGDAAVSGDAGGDAATAGDGGGGDPDSGPGDGGQDSGMMSCPGAVEICDNNQDDDCDGRTDCSDTDCAGLVTCCSALPENSQSLCSDNRDNDCNGQTDCGDLACGATAACCTNSGSENDTTACADGIDNDCDGKFDCADAQCAGIGSCCSVVVQGLDLGGTGCCVPDGQMESDQPNDGKDNDCDGLTDIPVLLSAFPVLGLPTSGQEVKLRFMTEMDPNATLQCSTRRSGQAPLWGACTMSGLDIKPFDSVASANPANNGVWTTQVRWTFTDGSRSAVYTFRYYVHHTLHNVNHCTQLHTDKQFFDTAIARLGVKDTGTVFKIGTGGDTFLTSPFIQVKYQVPVSGNSVLNLNGETPEVKMWSLRRRFTLHASNKYLLMTRNYSATRWPGSCNAAIFRIHISNHESNRNAFRTYSCQAVVMNRAGVGVCLDNGASMLAGPKLDPTKDSHVPLPAALNWPNANKFMWRQLLEKGRNFTRKCATSGCNGTYLPDRSQFLP